MITKTIFCTLLVIAILLLWPPSKKVIYCETSDQATAITIITVIRPESSFPWNKNCVERWGKKGEFATFTSEPFITSCDKLIERALASSGDKCHYFEQKF